MATVEELLEAEITKKYHDWLHGRIGSEDLYESFKAGYLNKVLEQNPSGNQLTSHLKEGNETLSKVNPDEPIFVLRAQDVTAPRVIMHWIELNLDNVSEAKQKEAYQIALAMKRYESRRFPT